jgi:glycosyltransferase involved in cell wall biosynthesis
MDAPAVSVCVRAYRDGAYLRTAVGSALRQTFGDLEVVIADDSGKLADVAESFGDPRVRYFANAEPAGPAGNLKRAFDVSRGRMLAILNDDDEWLPEFLASAVARLDQDPTLGVVFADSFWEFGGHEVTFPWPFAPGRHPTFLAETLERGVPCSATLLRRAVWEEGERALPLEPDMVGDALVWLRAAAAGWPFFYLAEPLAVIHIHPDQVSWGSAYPARAITTFEAFRFTGECERLRRARIAELRLAIARGHLLRGEPMSALREIRRSRRVAPAGLGIRGVLALTGTREVGIRLGAAHPRLLARALTVWQRVRPPLLRSSGS